MDPGFRRDDEDGEAIDPTKLVLAKDRIIAYIAIID
jgi:hypothetical protein